MSNNIQISELAAIVEQSPEGIIKTNEKFEIIYMNKAAEKLFGWTLDEIKGKTIDIFNADELSKQIQKELYEKIQKKETFIGKALNKRKNGDTFFCEFKITPLLDDNNNITGHAGFHKDISEFKKTECELKDISAIVAQSPTVVMTTDLDGNIEYVNKAFETITGYTVNEAIGSHTSIVKSEKNSNELYEDLWDKLNNNKIWKGEFINKRKNGSLYYEEAVIAPFLDENGAKTGYFAIKTDITKRKKAEIELKESEEKFRQLAENTADGLLILNSENIIEFVSPSYTRLFGYTEQEEIGREAKKIASLIHPDDRNRIFEFINQSINKKLETISYTYRAKHKKGHYIWRKDSTKLIYNKDGTLYKAIVICSDITEQKKAEIALKESEERYSILFDKSVTPTVLIDEDGSIAQFNEKAYQTLEYSKEEFAKLHISDIDIFDDKDTVSERLKLIAKNGYTDFETIHSTKHGKPLHIFVTSTIISLKNKTYFLSTFIDITDREIAKKNLKESEEKFRAIFEQASAGIIIADVESNIIDINPMMCNLLGYSTEELKKLSVRKLTHPDDIKDDYDRIKKIMYNSSNVKNIQKRFVHKNGNTIWTNVSVRVRKNTENKPVGVLLVIVDITEQKKIEKELTESQESLNLILNSFTDPVYVVSPEYKLLYANEAMKAQYGNNIFHTHCHKTIFDNDQRCDWCVFKKLSTENRVKTFELYIEKEDKYKQITIILLNDGNKLTIYHDITDLKKTQKELRENEQRYIAIFEKTLSPIVIVDENGYIEQFNEAAHIQLGYTKEEYAKLHISQIDILDDPEKVKERIKLIEQKGRLTFETKHKTKNGDVLNIMVTTSFITIKNKKYSLALFNDITPIREAEQEVKEYSNKLKEAQQLAQLGNWELDLKNNKLFWSDEIFRIFGEEPNSFEPTYEKFINYIHKDDREKVNNVYNASIDNKTSYEIEHRIITEQNIEKYVREKASHEFDESGKAIFSRGIVQDITDSKKAELQILERDKYLKAINNVTYLLLNRNDEKVFQLLAEIIKKQTYADCVFVFKKDKKSNTFKNIAQVVDENYTKKTDYNILDLSEKFVNILEAGEIVFSKSFNFSENDKKILYTEKTKEIIIVPIIIEEGTWGFIEIDICKINKKWFESEINFLKSVSQDLSQHLERKMAEKALRKSEEKFRTLIQNQGEGFGISDLNDNFTFVNAAAEEIFGVEPNTLIGRNINEFIDSKSHDRIREQNILRQEGKKSTYELKINKPNGQKIDIIVTATPQYGGSNNHIGTLAIFRDITEIRKKEKELKQALEIKNVLLKEVHHRVKNNLQTIRSLLFQQQYISKDENVKSVLQDSINRISSMSLIHEQIYKSENLEKINIQRYITDFAKQLFATYRKPGKNIHLNINVEEIYLELDKSIPLALILNEILSNAFKYAFNDINEGTIQIELQNLEKEKIRLCVKDTGIGLPNDFDPKKSNSLGMFIIQNTAVRQLRGKLDIQSEKNKGTKFEIIF